MRSLATNTSPGGRSEAVQRPFATAPCNTIRGARHTPWRAKAMPALDYGFPLRSTGQAPPPLLPAPGAATFSVPAGAPDLGRLRHLAVRLQQLSASKAGFSVAAQKAAAAGFSDQLDLLVHSFPPKAGPLVLICCAVGATQSF